MWHPRQRREIVRHAEPVQLGQFESADLRVQLQRAHGAEADVKALKAFEPAEQICSMDPIPSCRRLVNRLVVSMSVEVPLMP